MNYEEETFETYMSLREKYTVEEIVAISRRLLALSVSCVIAKDGCDDQQKNQIVESLKKCIPRDTEDCLRFIAKHMSDTIP